MRIIMWWLCNIYVFNNLVKKTKKQAKSIEKRGLENLPHVIQCSVLHHNVDNRLSGAFGELVDDEMITYKIPIEGNPAEQTKCKLFS